MTIKITFLLLAHQHPGIAKRLIASLTAAGHTVVVHYDKNAPDADHAELRTAFSDPETVQFAKRVRVAWGHWTMVAAVLSAIETIEGAGWEPDYVYLISGSDYPVRPAAELSAFLERHKGKDFIEGVPANTMRWVKGGPQNERFLYRHYVSWRDKRGLARSLMRIQRFLRMERDFVGGMEPFIGSQWWCLRWSTLQEIAKIGRKPEIVRFFQRTLIPDELYFQTLIYNNVPRAEIFERSLTLYQFTDYMVPVVFCSDRVEYLMRQPFFFARKMSPNRPELYDALDACWRGELPPSPVPDEAIGKISPEYETIRLEQRKGLPGVHVVGRPPSTWAENLERVQKPFFAVIGSSLAELGVAHRLLSANTDLICHGHLFRDGEPEFAPGQEPFALEIRNISAPNFLADLVRGARDKQMGFMLLFGHGWHIPDVLFEHPSAKVLVIHGDPLVGFIESLADDESRRASAFDTVSLKTVPPSILVDRFDRYQQDRAEYRSRIDLLVANAIRKGEPATWSWLMELDLDLMAPPKVWRPFEKTDPELGSPPITKTWVDETLDRWRDWLLQAGTCLGVSLHGTDEDPIWTAFAAELTRQQANRQIICELMKAGGRSLSLAHTPSASPIERA